VSLLLLLLLLIVIYDGVGGDDGVMTVQMDWHDDDAIGMSGAMSYKLSSTMMDTIRKIIPLYLTLLYRLMMMQLLPVDGYGVYTVPSGTARQ